MKINLTTLLDDGATGSSAKPDAGFVARV